MRKDSIFLLLPASLCALLGGILVISISLDMLPSDVNETTYYFIVGSFFTLSLVLFIAAFTTPLKTPSVSTTPEENAFFTEFKTKYKKYALNAYLINLGLFALITLIGIHVALLVGIESAMGVFILVLMFAIYFYIALVFLPKHLVSTCPLCNMKSLSCTVYLGSVVEFECKECNLKVNSYSGITNLNPNMALKRYSAKNAAPLS